MMIQRKKKGNERKKPRKPAGTRDIYFSKSIGLVSKNRESRESPTTVFFRTPVSQMIIFNQGQCVVKIEQ